MKTANRFFPSLIASAVLAVAAGQALAADDVQAKTRDQVKAELNEAIRTGNIVAGGESGQTLKDLFPGRYDATQTAQAKTRAEVKAELAEAIRTGDIVAGGESGQTLKQMAPARYADEAVQAQAVQVVKGKTRAQVKAELADALRSGDVVAGGESGQKLNEMFPARYSKEAAPVLAKQPKNGERSGS